MSQSVVLEVDRLTKIYKKGVKANDDISLAVVAGEVFGLLGHNGAGKTTLLNQVIGIARPTEGTIRLVGRDAVAEPDLARRVCSMQPQSQAPLDGVSPREAITMMARIRGADKDRAECRAVELIEALDIGEWADAKGDRLSGGVRRLTAFAMAAAEPGRLVMLDEPTNDVDPVRRRLLWDQISELSSSGCAVLLVTHNVIEAERAVDRLAILDQGRVVVQGTPSDLRGDHSGQLRLEFLAPSSEGATRLSGEIAGMEPAVVAGRRVMIPIRAEDCPPVLAWAQEQQRENLIESFSFNPVSLEDIYVRLVGPADNEPSDQEETDAPLVA